MILKRIVFVLSVILITGFCFFGIPADKNIDLTMPSWLSQELGISGTVAFQAPAWLVCQEAVASPYRRSVRRTARRTARRTSHRHNYYD